MREPGWHQEGADPDYRFSLANERTFLAWIRTALALIAGSVAVAELVPTLAADWVRKALGVAVALSALTLAIFSYHRWVANEVAMRQRRGLPYSRLPAVVVIALAVVAAIVAVLVAL
jgi:putative membrane protein